MYLEYESLRDQYNEAKSRYDELMLELEALFTRTQPNAIRYDTDKVQTSNESNMLENYIIDKEKIETRLDLAGSVLKVRLKRLELAEKELRNSKNLIDKIYCCRYLDRMKVRKIAKIVDYSEPQIYRYLNEIRKQLNIMRGTKNEHNY